MEKGDALLDRGYLRQNSTETVKNSSILKKSNGHKLPQTAPTITVSKVFVPKHSRNCESCWMMIYENCFSFCVDF